MIHCYADLHHHLLPPQPETPSAAKGWHQVDGVATKQRRHTRVTPLHYSSVFSTHCGRDFELLRCGRLGKIILELERQEVRAEITTTFAAHNESWEAVRFERAGYFVSKRSQTMPKINPLSQEGMKNGLAQMQDSQKQWQKNKGAGVCDFTEGKSLVV